MKIYILEGDIIWVFIFVVVIVEEAYNFFFDCQKICLEK